MPTWKKREASGGLRFYHICGECDLCLRDSLRYDGWELVREGEPVACAECTLNCRLTADGLWGAEEASRLAVCAECPEYAACALKGRYYC